MTKRGNWRRRVSGRVQKIRDYKYNLSTVVIGGLVVLVGGIAIGSNTNVWNHSLQVIGLKPNVSTLDLSSVEATYEQLAANYDGTLDKSKLIDGANHGLVAAVGDPYTVYFSKSEASDFSNGLNGQYSGIGAVLGLKDSIVTIQATLDSSPARKAGLLAGDQIVSVEGTSTQGWTVEKAATTIQGKAGTSVKLTIVRDGNSMDFSIVRAALTSPSVRSEVKDGIGIMTLTRFDETSSVLARQAANSFKSQNVKGVIVDLRGNGGGLVDAAQSIAGLWLNDKVVVSERTAGVTTNTLRTSTATVLDGIPTIVLMDGGTASASEILSGALRDNGAATLYGQQSFGKGVVQGVFDLDGGNQLKVTIASWYTPNGKNIGKTGLTPDVTITPTADQVKAGDDPVEDAALSKLTGN